MDAPTFENTTRCIALNKARARFERDLIAGNPELKGKIPLSLFAQRAGLDAGFMSHKLAGKHGAMSDATARKIEANLGLAEGWLDRERHAGAFALNPGFFTAATKPKRAKATKPAAKAPVLKLGTETLTGTEHKVLETVLKHYRTDPTNTAAALALLAD
jgi:hypothetical protein